MREAWFISDCIHTGYQDVLRMTPRERRYILEFIQDKQEMTQKELEKAKDAADSGRRWHA